MVARKGVGAQRLGCKAIHFVGAPPGFGASGVWRKWWRKLVVVETCWCTKFGVNNFVAAPPWFGASGGVRGRWRK